MKRRLNNETIDSLSMQFDEASLLFSSETLCAMQMSRIRGGDDGWFSDIWDSVKDGISDGVLGDAYDSVKNWVKSFFEDGPTGGGTKGSPRIVVGDGTYEIIPDGYDGTITLTVDSVVNGNSYGVKLELSPTPTPPAP